jgi:hypothetical protein
MNHMSRQSHRRRIALRLLLAVFVVALPACSSGGKGATPGSTTRAQPTAQAPPGSSAASAGAQQPVPVESNPPGDIPDNLAFVPYRSASGRYALTYPEGWTRSEAGARASFADKLNGIAVAPVPGPLTVSTARAQEVPRLQRSQPAFELISVESARLPAGDGVRIVYRRNSPPDQVTGRQYRDEVVEYLVGSAGRAVQLDLYGPVGADNVDAYRTISTSVALS